MADDAMIEVLLVDDEALVRAGLRAIIEAEPDLRVVAEEADGANVVAAVLRHRPALVLMDVRMPTVDGIAATEAILAKVPNPPRVVVVTTFANDEYVYAALRAGASGFLLKRARPADLVAALRLLAAGDTVLFPDAVRALVATYGPGVGPGRDRLAGAGLTEREAQVLRHMAAGLSNQEIAATLTVGVETVKTHVGNVLAKLGARDRTQAVVAAYESGFVPVR